MTQPANLRIELYPVGATIEAPAGTPLRNLLFEQGVEFPCGGQGRCRGCRIRVLKGDAPVNAAQAERLSPEELAAGWRLACQCALTDNLVIELRQWDSAILTNESSFAFTPRDGLGVAVDLGTTTVVAQLLDLRTGHVLGVRTALNPQARFGGDVMSRVQHAVANGGQKELEGVIRHEIGVLIRQMLGMANADAAELRRVVIVGNTVMQHLFCGIDAEPLSHYPFEPVNDGLQTLTPEELGWRLHTDTVVQFLPSLGGFVGSDILAGILATDLTERDELVGLVDLGTNGEIVLGNKQRMVCASTAAGPAFEGARISSGMRASTGAIGRVHVVDGEMRAEVIGDGEPRGICGSGLVDAVAAGLDLARIRPTGRFADGSDRLVVAEPISITQTDIRQLQLAKGAIAAGIRILLDHLGANLSEVKTLFLAGAFGNYIDRRSARRIGLLAIPEERVHPAGNTALLGAKMALFADDAEVERYERIRDAVQHVGLNEDPRFQDVYVEEMLFPA